MPTWLRNSAVAVLTFVALAIANEFIVDLFGLDRRTAFAVMAVCGLVIAWLLRETLQLSESSKRIFSRGASNPVLTPILIVLIGAFFGGVLFGGSYLWMIYEHKKNSPPFPPASGPPPHAPVIKPPAVVETSQVVPTKPENKQEKPAPIQVAPSFGNLRERCEALSQDVYAFASQRNEKERALGEKPSQEQRMKLWKANGIVFGVHYLERIVQMQQELAVLHIKDERLDGLLEHLQRNFLESRNPGREILASMPVMQIEEVAERLHALAQKVPQ